MLQTICYATCNFRMSQQNSVSKGCKKFFIVSQINKRIRWFFLINNVEVLPLTECKEDTRNRTSLRLPMVEAADSRHGTEWRLGSSTRVGTRPADSWPGSTRRWTRTRRVRPCWAGSTRRGPSSRIGPWPRRWWCRRTWSCCGCGIRCRSAERRSRAPAPSWPEMFYKYL